MAINYLELGDLIVNRLSTNISSIEFITSAIDLATITDNIKTTPSLNVVYIGDDLGEYAGQGSAYQIKQTWGIIIVVKNLQDVNYRLAELGGFISEVIASIQGWMPDNNRYEPLYREPAPNPIQGLGGYVLFPLYFSSRFLTTGI